MDVGELDNAIELLSKVIEQSPEFAEGWNKRATVYFLKGELNKCHENHNCEKEHL